jgi:anti-anti-sigma factor
MRLPSVSPDGDPRRAEIQVHALQKGVVISLSGDHDLSTKSRLIDALARVRQQQWVVIDLQRCTFVDSTIIAAILAACRRGVAREPSVSVVLPDDTSYVWRALSVMGLRDLVPAHVSIEAALEAAPNAENARPPA